MFFIFEVIIVVGFFEMRVFFLILKFASRTLAKMMLLEKGW